jgi:mannitol/fructose-specific phosphotransferase system IIA component (Ntr-type)
MTGNKYLMGLKMILFVASADDESRLSRIEDILERLHFERGIDYERKPIADQELTRKHLQTTGIAQKEHIRIPHTKTGYVKTHLMIYINNEELVWYPQYRKKSKSMSVEDFLSALHEKKILSLASGETSKILECAFD